MKKLFFLLLTGVVLASCESDPESEMAQISPPDTKVTAKDDTDMSDFSVYQEVKDYQSSARVSGKFQRCGTLEMLQKDLEQDPSLADRMFSIEKNVRTSVAEKQRAQRRGFSTREQVLTIPVVVHVLYNDNSQNVSRERVASQIDILNTSFNRQDPRLSLVPDEFASLVGDASIRFELEELIRKQTSRRSFTGEDMFFDEQGGSDIRNPSQYLNIYVATIEGGLLGFARFPGSDPSVDGVVINTRAFGDIGNLFGSFDGGKTAVHEVGHWLNLRHIWGDGDCFRDDFVSDTPLSSEPNLGCPSYPTIRCQSNDMTMNYMDYVNDDCMYMFTEGQSLRMRATLTGPRSEVINPGALSSN